MSEFGWFLVVKGCVWENIGKREFISRSKMVLIMLMKIMMVMTMVTVMMMMVIVMMVTMMMVMEPTRE